MICRQHSPPLVILIINIIYPLAQTFVHLTFALLLNDIYYVYLRYHIRDVSECGSDRREAHRAYLSRPRGASPFLHSFPVNNVS